MSRRRRLVSYSFPGDLVLIAVLGVWVLAGVGGGPVVGQVVLGPVAVLFAPGYALAAILFPSRRSSTDVFATRGDGTGEEESGITSVERLVLAIGLSVCMVPLFGIALDYTQWGIQPSSLLGAVGTSTLVLAAIAAVRRQRVPPEERFDPNILGLPRAVADGIRVGSARSTVTLFLVVGLVIAGSGIGVAVLTTDRGEQFTEFYLVTEDPETGELTSAGYPDEVTDNTETVQVGITNKEGVAMEYTVVVLVQSFDTAGRIQAVETLDVFTVSVPQGETVREPRSLRPELSGEGLRVTYLLYVDSPPEDVAPSTDNAYRHVHIWVDAGE